MSNEVRVWVNGALVGEREPALAALDHGITVGDGAFETCKIIDGEVFAADRHLARMERTLAGLGLPPARPQPAPAGHRGGGSRRGSRSASVGCGTRSPAAPVPSVPTAGTRG